MQVENRRQKQCLLWQQKDIETTHILAAVAQSICTTCRLTPNIT